MCRKLRIWSHLLKKSFMENFIFCALLNNKMLILSSMKDENLTYLMYQSPPELSCHIRKYPTFPRLLDVDIMKTSVADRWNGILSASFIRRTPESPWSPLNKKKLDFFDKSNGKLHFMRSEFPLANSSEDEARTVKIIFQILLLVI